MQNVEDELTSILVDDDSKQLVIVDSAEQQGCTNVKIAKPLKQRSLRFFLHAARGLSEKQ
jgi:hypothetical protein